MQDELQSRLGRILNQSKGSINKNWVLLDSKSTIDIFCNSSLLSNIRKVNIRLDLYCNTGKTQTNMVGSLQGYCFNTNNIANILSLHRVAERFHVTYDSCKSNYFTV